MADSKKYDGSQWEHSLRKLTTATEAVENPLYSDGTAITAYTLKGNTVQSGTPTPSNPVEVQGVGVRTENLFDYTTMVSTPKNAYLNDSGEDIANSNWSYTDYIPCDGTDFVLSSIGGFNPAICFYDSSKNFIFGQKYGTSSTSTKQSIFVSVPTTAKYIRFSYCYTSSTPQNIDALENIMLNTGLTAKPFEPYGYKIPISSGGVTTNIYLGSTQTVRQIKKYEITGNEDWVNVAGTMTNPPYFRLPIGAKNSIIAEMIISSHYEQIFISSDNANNGIGIANSSVANSAILKIRDTNTFTDVPTLKTYLQQQYSNGTPVTVWYVLATPETAAVNEPLMKIGDYADTLSNATSIPTTEGANSITVDTTVQPSEFTATWTGWHDSSVKEYDGSDWQ